MAFNSGVHQRCVFVPSESENSLVHLFGIIGQHWQERNEVLDGTLGIRLIRREFENSSHFGRVIKI